MNRKQGKERKNTGNSSSWGVTEKRVGHIEVIKCMKGTERRTQQGEQIRVAVR